MFPVTTSSMVPTSRDPKASMSAARVEPGSNASVSAGNAGEAARTEVGKIAQNRYRDPLTWTHRVSYVRECKQPKPPWGSTKQEVANEPASPHR